MRNTDHLDGLLGCLVEDATGTLVPCALDDPTVYRGQAESRSSVRTYLLHGHLCSRRHYRADGDRVVWMVRVTTDCVQSLGIDWVEPRAEAIVRGGMIVPCTVMPRPESLATLETAKQGSEGETEADPPAETLALSGPARKPSRCLRAHLVLTTPGPLADYKFFRPTRLQKFLGMIGTTHVTATELPC